jgi:hypothetical protein
MDGCIRWGNSSFECFGGGPSISLKAAETRAMVPFLVNLLSQHLGIGEKAKLLHSAGTMAFVSGPLDWVLKQYSV